MNDSASLETLSTAGAVIDALGGSTAAGELAGNDVRHASNWRKAGRMPPRTFLVFRQALAAIGKTAPAALWGIDEPANSENSIGAI